MGTFGGRPFDAVIESVGAYVKGNDDSGCPGGSKFPRLRMRRSQQAPFTMTFRDSLTDEPVTLPAFRLSFLDIDAGAAPAWKEQLQVLGFDEYTLDEQTHLTVTDENTDSNPNAPSDLWFHSTPAYNPASYAADNPTDPSALTETQKRLAVSFVFLATSQVSL